jgi:uncharacterized iron-regulated membrane protein
VVRVGKLDGAIRRVDLPETETTSGAARRWIHGLHFARFGGLPLRFLYLVRALATCATILTGNWVWLARRESRRPSASHDEHHVRLKPGRLAG